MISKEGKKRKFSIHIVKSYYITLVLTRNLTNVSPRGFSILPSEKNKTKLKKYFRSSKRTPQTFSTQSY